MSARVAAVVLAAGSSSRMGRPKQLIQFNGQSLIRRIVRTVLACDVGAVWVTTASNGVDFEAELNGLLWTRAEVTNSQEGQSQSVRAGLHAVEMRGNFDAILFLPCDLPLLSTSHLNALIGEFRSEKWNIVASRFDGVLGAPMIVGRSVWPEVEHLRGDVGARKVLATHPQTTTFIEWEDGKLDLDTPADVEACSWLVGGGARVT